ncbi:MAG TPA: DUF1080 domain-containing protein [Caulobacteraceae bacterium]|nr:DUF1080 domain-containing protein [Caulobacteraceae bacterium]
MNRRSLLALGLLGIGTGLAGGASAAARRGGPAWKTLLDGKSLDNWTQIGTANWRIEDGAAVADKGAGYLVSKDLYTDYDLKAEFWVNEAANSGIFIRATNPLNVTATNAYECNIFEKRPDPAYATGAIVNVAKITTVPKTADRWSTMEISARGPLFTVWVNGVKTVDNAHDDAHAHGRIALQYGTGVVKFRKVQIRPV